MSVIIHLSKHQEIVSRVNLKLFKTICMLIISLMDSWVNLWYHYVWVLVLNKWGISDAWVLCLTVGRLINHNLSDILCEFSCYFNYFLGRTHVWALVFTLQKYNCSIKWKMHNFMKLWCYFHLKMIVIHWPRSWSTSKAMVNHKSHHHFTTSQSSALGSR